MVASFKHMFQIMVWGLVALIAPSVAQAHTTDQSYIYLYVTETELVGKYEAEFQDLGAVLDLDRDGDGRVTEAEIMDQDALVKGYLSAHLTMSGAGRDLSITPDRIEIFRKGGLEFAQIYFAVTGFDTTPETVVTTFSGMWDTFQDGHSVFGLIGSNARTGLEGNESSIGVIFAPTAQTQVISLSGLPTLELFSIMFVQGIWHILQGIDHLLFLAVLLLPSVMVFAGSAWSPAEKLSDPLLTLVKLVTAFTVAHAVTLAISATGVMQLSKSAVEPVFASCIAVMALAIFVPALNRFLIWVVAVFGLVHGLGYALVLQPVNIEPNSRFVTQLGFNLGMEAGQLVIVALALPLLYMLRTRAFYASAIMKAGGGVLLFVSLFWLEERTLDLVGPIGPTLKTMLGV